MSKELTEEEMHEIFNLGLEMMPDTSRPKRYLKLIYGEEPEIIEEAFRIVLDSGIYMSNELFKLKHGAKRTELEQNAMIIFQMVMTKGVTILDLYGGLDYANAIDREIKLSSFIDPFSISLIVRNQLESFANFNNIFLSSDNNDVIELLHNFWILCGLKRRQSFIHEGMDNDQIEKGKNEKLRIDKIKIEIENNPIYKSLSEKNQKHVGKVLKTNIFQLQFDGKEFSKVSWAELFNAASGTDKLKNIYAEMSLKSHPSYVSVFQFAQSGDIEKNHSQSSFYLHMSRIIMAFLISDCIKLFPKLRKIYNNLPELNKALISSINRNLRDEQWLVLDDDVAYGQKIQVEVFEFIDSEINKLSH